MEKKIATRILIHDPVKNTILAVHPSGRKWKTKDGDVATGVFSIPGGEIDEGEDKEECIIRETEEETGLKIDKSKLEYLGFYKYIEYKDLEIFYYKKEDIELSKLKCKSTFEANGRQIPEVNGFINLVYPEEKRFLFFSLQKVLEKVEQDHPDLFS